MYTSFIANIKKKSEMHMWQGWKAADFQKLLGIINSMREDAQNDHQRNWQKARRKKCRTYFWSRKPKPNH